MSHLFAKSIFYILIQFLLVCVCGQVTVVAQCVSIDAGLDATVDCDTPCADLTANYTVTGETDSYQTSSMSYAPPHPYTGLANQVTFGGIVSFQDDIWYDVIDIPFTFCYFGDQYNQLQIGANGVVRFDVNATDTSNNYAFTENLPNNTNPTLGEANIFGVGHDINPAVAGSNPEIGWEVFGTAPCRTLAISFANVTHFGNCSTYISTTQIVLYETTNIIEIYIQDKPFCAAWNGGNAVLGIQNNEGTIAYVPLGRNTSDSPWFATNEAWRFTPNGNANYSFNWFDDQGNNLGSDTTVNVCPTENTTYTAQVSYTNCDSEVITETDDVMVTANGDFVVDIGPHLNLCDGDPPVILNADISSTVATYQWFFNGTPVLGATNVTYTAAASGTYRVEVTEGKCTLSDETIITFYEVPLINTLTNFPLCDDAVADGETEFDLSLKTAGIIGAQTDVTVSYHLNASDANINLDAIGPLYTNTLGNPQTIYVRLESNLNTDCYIIDSFNLIVNPVPVLVTPNDLILCDDDDGDPNGVRSDINLTIKNSEITAGNTTYVVNYYDSLANAELGTGAGLLSNPYTNVNPLEIIYARVEDGEGNGCFDITSFNLIIEVPPTTNVPQPLTFCDPDNDGIGLFTLTDANNAITGGDPLLSVSYHGTLDNALNNQDALISPYQNIQEDTQVVYARVVNTSHTSNCPAIVELPLEVYNTPQVMDPIPLNVCDDGDANIEFTVFNLTEREDEILNGLNPTDFPIFYYEDQADAVSGADNYIITPENYTNTTAGSQIIYVRVLDATNSIGCASIIQLQLNVNSIPVPITPTPLEECDDDYYNDMDGVTNTFDLTSKNPEITGGNASWDVKYYETMADALANTAVITNPDMYTNTAIGGNPANPQTIFVRVTDTNNNCSAFTTLTLRVNPNPTPEQDPENIMICDDVDTGDGIENNIDLTQYEADFINGELGVSATYYEDFNDAELGANAISNPTVYTNTNPNLQTIYVRVANDTTGCFTIIDFNIIINPLPQATTVTDFTICEVDTDGFALFNLETKNEEVLAGQNPADFVVTYYESENDAEMNVDAIVSPYINTIPDRQTIYVRITNIETGCFISTPKFDVIVEEGAVAATPATPLTICDLTNDNDGFAQFNLREKDAEILNGQPTPDYVVTYYGDFNEAEAGVSSLPDDYVNQENPETIYARVDNVNTNCYAITSFNLVVALLPEVDIEDQYIICINTNGTETITTPPIIYTGLSTADYIFSWVENSNPTVELSTDSSFIPITAGNYTVTVMNIETGCLNTDTTTVIQSSPPIVNAEVVTEAFAGTHNIDVQAIGDGIYEFSVDNGPWFSNDPNDNMYSFTDVSSGEHTITARDINGCGQASDTVFVIDYPLYFTPNGDTYNETWNINGIEGLEVLQLVIFDKQGKLLKQLNPNGNGWDGNYNGKPLPSSDYWFVLDYIEPSSMQLKQLKAHFTLKR